MQVAETKTKAPAQNHSGTKRKPFFNNEVNSFFLKESEMDAPFFGRSIQTGIGSVIQRQEQPEAPETKDTPGQTPAPGPLNKPSRSARCIRDPQFPDFGCFATQLKLDVDENLISNAHQFYRVATLYPGNNEMMWNTFMRYGLGVNLLETTFGFTGVNKKWGTILSYGIGVGMKSYQFAADGKLQLDIPIPLGKGINLDIKFDLNTRPAKPEDESVNTSIGISRRF